MTWTYDTVTELCRRMEAKAATGFRVSAKTAGLVIEALRHYARDHLGDRPASYTVDVWDHDASRIEIHYAKVADLNAARDVFRRAVKQHPAVLVTIRQGARVVERSMGEGR